jgi:carbon-monoxide dehydrogenase large subunit
MDVHIEAAPFAGQKFGVGQPVPRKEDPKLLRGEGRYSDDLSLPGQLHAVMVRSRHAHGRLLAIDTDSARGMPGVRLVVTGADFAAAGYPKMAGSSPVNNSDGSPVRGTPQWALATDRVRYVGEPIVCIVAETVQQARDAAEAVMIEVDPLAAVTTAAAAAAAGAPLLHDGVPSNVALEYHYGDAAQVAAAFAQAAHVTRLAIRNSRLVVCPMEPRSAIAEYDAMSERFTLRSGSQGVLWLKDSAVGALGVKPQQVRVLTGHVGGSFGMKIGAYPEYICILHAARVLGVPVKWTDHRSDSFLSDAHGRDHEMTAELALDAHGRFLALRVTGFGNLGAYLKGAITLPSTVNLVKNIVSVYRTPLLEVDVRCVYTNTTPVGAYRGAGRPEGNYYMERLIETAAHEMRLDAIQLRRLNHIAPEQIPFDAASGSRYDSGDFGTVLARALAFSDWNGFPARRAESRARGKLRGRGIGQFLEVTAPPTKEMGGIRFEPDGNVTIITGTLDYGQGHASPFAQVLVDKLGVPFERIALLQGDSDQLIAGGGTGGSKSLMASGAAIIEAGDIVIEKGRQIAAQVLEADVADIEFTIDPAQGGRFGIVGTDRRIGIMELAERLREGMTLPEGVPATLDVAHVHEFAPSAYPNGCHIAEVEIDPETGEVSVVRYQTVNDFGVLVNPMLVEGQAHGGIVQGIGQALLEHTVFDADGQLLSGSFMDYALPRADHAPSIGFASHPVPARTNLLGAKGCGEAGCAGSLPAVMNAVVDALAEFGVTHIDMPATPERVWRAMRNGAVTAA